jgi:hypothetical protein
MGRVLKNVTGKDSNFRRWGKGYNRDKRERRPIAGRKRGDRDRIGREKYGRV